MRAVPERLAHSTPRNSMPLVLSLISRSVNSWPRQTRQCSGTRWGPTVTRLGERDMRAPSHRDGDGEERPGSGRLRGNHTSAISQAGALFAMQDTRWDHGLKVAADGQGLVGHAGA